MATASASCGFCLRRDDEIRDPRKLPCSHVHCLECLNSQKEDIGRSRCPLEECHKPFQVEMAELRCAEVLAVKYECHARDCGKDADVFCSFQECLKMYCNQHEQTHNDVHKGAHLTMSIDEYRPQSRKLQRRSCSKHEGKPLKRGCGICLSVFCEKCIDESGVCVGDGDHNFLPLDKLSGNLLEKTSSLTQRLEVKEATLHDISKKTVNYIKAHKTATSDMVKTLEETQKEQIAAIESKYAELKKTLKNQRSQTVEKLNKFLNSDVRKMQDNLRTMRLRTEAKVQQDHQVDVIEEHGEITKRIDDLLEEKIPTFSRRDVAKTCSKAKSRETEVDIEYKELTIKEDDEEYMTAF